MVDNKLQDPIVIHLNVEEIVDGAWSSDRSQLPALSSIGNSPVPNRRSQLAAYRSAYEKFVERFTATVNRLALKTAYGREVLVETGDLLRPWYEGPTSSFGEPLFDLALKQTSLPKRSEIE